MAAFMVASSSSTHVSPLARDAAQAPSTPTSARKRRTASTAVALSMARVSVWTMPPGTLTTGPGVRARSAAAPADRHRTLILLPTSSWATRSQVVLLSMMTLSPSQIMAAVARARARLTSRSSVRRRAIGWGSPRRGARSAPPCTLVTSPSRASSVRSRRMVTADTSVSRPSAVTLMAVVGDRTRRMRR